jgi:hypothetical protein
LGNAQVLPASHKHAYHFDDSVIRVMSFCNMAGCPRTSLSQGLHRIFLATPLRRADIGTAVA